MITITFEINSEKKLALMTTKAKAIQILEGFKVNHPISKGDLVIDALIKQINES